MRDNSSTKQLTQDGMDVQCLGIGEFLDADMFDKFLRDEIPS